MFALKIDDVIATFFNCPELAIYWSPPISLSFAAHLPTCLLLCLSVCLSVSPDKKILDCLNTLIFSNSILGTENGW